MDMRYPKKLKFVSKVGLYLLLVPLSMSLCTLQGGYSIYTIHPLFVHVCFKASKWTERGPSVCIMHSSEILHIRSDLAYQVHWWSYILHECLAVLTTIQASPPQKNRNRKKRKKEQPNNSLSSKNNNCSYIVIQFFSFYIINLKCNHYESFSRKTFNDKNIVCSEKSIT